MIVLCQKRNKMLDKKGNDLTLAIKKDQHFYHCDNFSDNKHTIILGPY